jgi:iron(III) transport system permease protein
VRLAAPADLPATAARLVQHPRLKVHPLLLAAALVVAAFALLPAGFILSVLLQSGWDTAVALIFRQRVGEILVSTLVLQALAVPLSVGLALILAWLTERSDLPGRALWRWLAVAPLAIPAFVMAYAVDSTFPMLRGLWPAVGISVLAYSPLVYLPVIAQLRRLDPAAEEIAATLGQSPATIFLTVVLPQLRLAILGGALLIALHLLAEYGLFVLIRYDTLTVAIVNQFQAVYDGPAANLMGIVLVACAAGVLGLDAWLRRDRRYARVGSGAARSAPLATLGPWSLPLLLLPIANAALAVGLPIVTLVRWMLTGGVEAWHLPELGAAFGQSFFYAALGAAFVCLAALPIAWMSARAPGPVQRALENVHLYVGGLPGVIVALALVAITVRVALPFYQTVATMLVAYVLLFLPRAIVSIRASLAQVPVELQQAATALGRPPLSAAIGITLRLATPGIAAGMALVAMGIMTELTATLMLSPIGTETLATQFWARTGEFDHVGAAPFALAMVVLSIPLCVILHRQATAAR